MNQRIEKLQELGCDIDDAMARFLDDEAFYLECFDSVIHDEKFDDLNQLMNGGDEKRKFECAHTLKGLVANLGLTSLNEIMVTMVEKLREDLSADVSEEYRLLIQEREKYLSI